MIHGVGYSMQAKVVVVCIHGMGAQYKVGKQEPGEISFSAGMRAKVANRFGVGFEEDVCWTELYWADILQDRQESFAHALRTQGLESRLRTFVLYNLSDPACYQQGHNEADSSYERIHARITESLRRIDTMVPAGTPVIFAAHSLGGHILSNYIYDAMANPATPRHLPVSGFAGFRRLYTFGCNIPVFMMAVKHIKAITFPGMGDKGENSPWWVNLYDRDDPLGFPLGYIGGTYNELAAARELVDIEINAGGLPINMTPFSHNEYWTDKDVYGRITDDCLRFAGRGAP
jgi:hypothetical protein